MGIFQYTVPFKKNDQLFAIANELPLAGTWKLSKLILYTSDRKPIVLIDPVTVYIAAFVGHVTVPCICSKVLRSTPPETVDPKTEEPAKIVTAATR